MSTLDIGAINHWYSLLIQISKYAPLPRLNRVLWQIHGRRVRVPARPAPQGHLQEDATQSPSILKRNHRSQFRSGEHWEYSNPEGGLTTSCTSPSHIFCCFGGPREQIRRLGCHRRGLWRPWIALCSDDMNWRTCRFEYNQRVVWVECVWLFMV